MLILVKLQTSAWNFTKINTPTWMFFTFFKVYKWYQIAQRITNDPAELAEIIFCNKNVLGKNENLLTKCFHNMKN